MVSLRNALEKNERPSDQYREPPPTGGTQISVRFSKDRLAILSAIAEHSGWNRNEVINTFVDRGFFELFHYLGDDVADRIMGTALVPIYNSRTVTMNDISSYSRFRIFPSPQVIRPGRPAQLLERTWLIQHADRERETITFSDATTMMGRSLPPIHMTHIEKVWPDTAEDEKSQMKNAMLLLNMQVVFTEKGPQLLPCAPDTAVLNQKRSR